MLDVYDDKLNYPTNVSILTEQLVMYMCTWPVPCFVDKNNDRMMPSKTMKRIAVIQSHIEYFKSQMTMYKLW